MIAYVSTRLMSALAVVILVSFGVFVLLSAAPGDAATASLGENATSEQIAQARERMGLDRPVLVQYADWAGHAIRGDLGTSATGSRPVAEAISSALPVTLSLAAVTIGIATLLGLSLGAWAAVRGHLAKRVASGFAAAAVAIPSFWLALILLQIFANRLGWMPTFGYVPLLEDPAEWLRHLLLPAVALGAVCAAELVRHTETALGAVLEADFIRIKRSAGLREGAVMRQHAARNAMIPVMTVIGLQVNLVLSGAVVTEAIFGLPGIGQLAVNAVNSRDLPMVQGVVIVATVVAVTVNLLVDLLYGVVNPRIRIGS